MPSLRSVVCRVPFYFRLTALLVCAVPLSVRSGQAATLEAELVSIAPTLERAVTLLNEGRLDQARASFAQLAGDATQPAFVRGLAQLGLAETLLAANEPSVAIATWKDVTEDLAIPSGLRDSAQRRWKATERMQRGLPGYDPAAFRTALADIPEADVVLHVAPNGDDSADGSKSQPFRSLQAARDAVRTWKTSRNRELAPGSVQVVVHGGRYLVESTLQLTREDSGTASSPIVYRAAGHDRPIFHGGRRIVSWRPITDPKRRNRLDATVRDRVLEADIRALGVTNLGDATTLRRRPELFCDGAPQTLARWPNERFVHTGEVLGNEKFEVRNSNDGCRDGKFRYVEDRPTRWSDEPDVRLYGYWFWDWFEQYQRVSAIDAQARTFTLSPPFSNYGYRQGQRYFAVNVFRELDRPGEWYLDRRNGFAYWLPAESVNVSTATTILSIFDGPFVTMKGVDHVRLIGLTFQDARGDGIHVRGGTESLIAGCTLRRLGGDAILINGGRGHGIFGCAMHTLGCGGTRVAGGDRSTLARGNHFVENCTVQNISRLKRTYAPAVHLDGCGNRVAHNLFQNIPSSAMRIEGNEQLIELNVIRDVVKESDDQGGLDMFGNPLYRGVIIRWNHWIDIIGGTQCGAAGVRLDDMISGVTVQGNIFERCGAVLFGGVQIHGGKENLIDGNVFLDCYSGISHSRWQPARWLESIERFLPQASQPPYVIRYPKLKSLKDNPNVNYICRNLFARSSPSLLRDGGIQQIAINATTEKAFDARQLSAPDAARNHPPLRRALPEQIPVDDMGPYNHPWRVALE